MNFEQLRNMLPPYGILLTVGFCIAVFFLYRRFMKEKRDPYQKIWSFFKIIMISLAIGQAEMLLLILIYTGNLIKFDPRTNSSFILSLAGLIIFSFFITKQKRQILFDNFGDYVTAILIWQIFGKLACFKAGCCYGFCSIISPHFPIQLFETSLFLFAMVVFFKLPDGMNKEQTSYFYLLFYGSERFIAEFFRSDSEYLINGVSIYQVLSILIVVFSFLLLVNFDRDRKRDLVVCIPKQSI